MTEKEASTGRQRIGTRLWEWARIMKRDLLAVYLAARHPLTPWYVKVIAAAVVGYALSPIDLIPDFVPVLGYLDDIILLPIGIAIVVKLLPPAVLDSCRREAERQPPAALPGGWLAAGMIAVIWLLVLYGFYRLFS